MKWCRFTTPHGTAFGIVEGDRVIEVEGSPFEAYKKTARSHAVADVYLYIPVMPPNFYCMGANYLKHNEWGEKRFGITIKMPKEPEMGYRSQGALVPTGAAIEIPADAPGPVQFEGELVAVIGKRAKNLKYENALSCVLGYTLGNDVSDRGWQFADRTFWRSKNADTFKPMGPFIATDLDPAKLRVGIRLNGAMVSEYSCGDMVFDLASCIARLTRYVTLVPGDVIWLGTDGATEPDLKAGDVVEVTCPEIGTLRSPVTRAGN